MTFNGGEEEETQHDPREMKTPFLGDRKKGIGRESFARQLDAKRARFSSFCSPTPLHRRCSPSSTLVTDAAGEYFTAIRAANQSHAHVKRTFD